MDKVDVMNVQDAHFSCCDASGNSGEAFAKARNGDTEGCIERLEWMLENLALAKSRATRALESLKDQVDAKAAQPTRCARTADLFTETQP